MSDSTTIVVLTVLGILMLSMLLVFSARAFIAVCTSNGIRRLYHKICRLFVDPLEKYEPISDDEFLLLTVVDESLYEDLLCYTRTMLMSVRLQDFLSDKKDALESISYYMMLQVLKSEQEKKEKWQRDRGAVVTNRAHNEKMILKRLGKL